MILTEENRRTVKKTYAIACLSTTNPTWTCLGLKAGPCGDRYTTDRPNQDRALSTAPSQRSE